MNPIESITQRLADRRRAHTKMLAMVAQTQRDAELIAAEIKAYEESLRFFTASDADQPVPAAKTSWQTRLGVSPERKRALREKWKRVFRNMHSLYPNGANYAQIGPLVAEAGTPMTGAALRTQMMLFTQQGLLNRVDAGVFTVTEDGLAASISEIGSPPAEAGENPSFLD